MEASTSTGNVHGLEAEPLPVKVGERGFDASRHIAEPTLHPSASTVSLPLGPHPAEREDSRRTPSPSPRSNPDSPPNGSTNASSTLLPNTSSTSLASSTNTLSKLNKLSSKLRPSDQTSRYLLGTSPSTFTRFLVQLACLSGTVAAWIFSVTRMSAAPPAALSDPSNGMGEGAIFVHVGFTMVTLLQLLFLERCIYRLRGERYRHLHPSLPTESPEIGRGRGRGRGVPYAPWHRQPLPTYAAALGYRGTGDVEDNEVARIVAMGRGDVPPLYGNTRGSTLLAYGMIARPASVLHRPDSVHSKITEMDEAGSRPVSYGRSQELDDAHQARMLEEALRKLEG